jgi:hypothetical protein
MTATEMTGKQMIRVAKVFDTHDADGRATIGPDRERLADADERERLLAYLRSGRMVLSTTGRDRDRLVPERGQVVPLSFRTDGTWVWSEALAYYLADHLVAPEPELREHAAALGYQVPEVPDEAVREAGQAVLGR